MSTKRNVRIGQSQTFIWKIVSYQGPSCILGRRRNHTDFQIVRMIFHGLADNKNSLGKFYCVADVVMYWGTRKPETRGKNLTFLEPEPENQNLSQTRNPTIKTPRGFQISRF